MKTMDGFTKAYTTGQGTLGSHTTSKLAFGHFSSSATFLLTPANLSTSLHSICCMSSFLSFYVQEYFFKVLHSHIKALKWHLKETFKWHILLVY